jgi:predicted N-formylglutamate amidohydrolase
MTVADDSEPLLTANDSPVFALANEGGAAPILVICDHASRRIPHRLGDLGLAAHDRARHIAWDIGAADVARHIAGRLDAPAILAGYSRLVVDCNRHLHDPSLMPAVSDGTTIPANAGMAPAERQARIDALYRPYHRAIADRLDRFAAAGVMPTLLSIHSCTPEMNGRFRPWHIGVCWAGDRRLAGPVMEALARDPEIVVGDNQPYALDLQEDYSVPVHALSRGLPYLMVEVRQDLIATPAGARHWADVLLGAVRPALANLP